MSQSDLEKRSGIPKTTLSRYENGHVEPSLCTLGRLAEALGIHAGRLLPGDPRPEDHFTAGLLANGVTFASTDEAAELATHVAEFLRGLSELGG